jgi:uncharacterized protein (DUF849 family)
MSGEVPLIIEVRCNETTYRKDNSSLPYSPKEIIEQAILAWKSGASIFHWHGRNSKTGDPQNDLELYLEVYKGIRQETDLLLHPTLGYITQPRVEDRVRHILAVKDDPILNVDMVPVDFGSINVDYWDPEGMRFVTNDKVYINTRANLEAVLKVFKEHSFFVSSVCWDVGQIRTARCFQEMGLLSKKTLWEFVFTGEVMPAGAAPTLSCLQAMINEIPEGDPWLVLNWNGDVLRLAAWAITMGGHVAIGLGDYHYSRFGKPHHGILVDKVVNMAGVLGRPIATPSETRKILELQQREELPVRDSR